VAAGAGFVDGEIAETFDCSENTKRCPKTSACMAPTSTYASRLTRKDGEMMNRQANGHSVGCEIVTHRRWDSARGPRHEREGRARGGETADPGA
jgi:hypothetical protein